MMRKAVRSAKENDFNPRIPLGMRHKKVSQPTFQACNFNPRIPLGMRREEKTWIKFTQYRFQSTHSIRNATLTGFAGISIHAFH